MINAIIIDDEKGGRETLAFLIKSNFESRVSVIDSCDSLDKGVISIEKNRPQLIFLDIEMPNETGLAILNRTNIRDFEIIITTAHRQYGIDAIKLGVADYLLKPIDTDELEISIRKIEKKLSDKNQPDALKEIIQKLEGIQTSPGKIPLLVQNNKTIFVDLKDIILCEAGGNYTTFWLTNGKKELVSKLLKDVETQINSRRFFRAHKSYLINLDQVKSYSKSDDHIYMVDGSIIPLSRNEKSDFMRLMNI